MHKEKIKKQAKLIFFFNNLLHIYKISMKP